MLDISPSTKYKMDEILYAAVTFVIQTEACGKLYLEKLAENSGGRMFDATDMTNLESSFA